MQHSFIGMASPTTQNRFKSIDLVQRAFDVVFACTAIFLLSPLFLLLFCLVRMRLGSPVFFKQMRPGKNAKPFYLFKFRSMTNKLDEKAKLLPDELRLNSFGLFLRRYSLDELPQLINVLRGDISLVGPRPLLMSYLPRYTPEQSRRHSIKPGLTGWAQINGRNAISWEEKFDLDLWYLDNRSFFLNLKILYLTFEYLIRSDGITPVGKVTMPEFMGTQLIKTRDQNSPHTL